MEKYRCSVENFMKDNYSICREERQYAVFLYDILRKYKDPDEDERKKKDGDVFHIFDACSIPPNAKIEHVFYEPTFMRDFFERNRRIVLGKDRLAQILLQITFSPSDYKMDKEDSFNYKLVKYVCEKVYGEKNVISDMKLWNLEEYNLGGSISEEFKQKEMEIIRSTTTDKESQKKAGVIQDRIRQMMNAKSDIAVIYSVYNKEGNEERKLLFLECKFESGESTYKGSESEECDETVTQRAIQWMVADFLCSKYLEGIQVADVMKENKSCLVKFVRNKRKEKKEIEIEKLIAYSYWI